MEISLENLYVDIGASRVNICLILDHLFPIPEQVSSHLSLVLKLFAFAMHPP